MRILVTGWDGLLGSELVPRLRDASHTVSGFGVGDGDVSDPAFVRERCRETEPEVVVHLAAMTAVDRCEDEPDTAFRVNAEGSRVVAQEAERVGARVLALSTDYVFDGERRSPYTEKDPTAPLSVYGRSKQAGEEAVREVCTHWAVVRSAWLYGPGGPNFIETILGLLAERDTVNVVDDQTGSPTSAAALAGGLTELVSRGAEGLYHLVNRGEATWCGLAREAVRLSGGNPERIRPVTTAEFQRPAPRPRYSVLDTHRVAERHDVTLAPWQEALAAYVQRRTGGAGETP